MSWVIESYLISIIFIVLLSLGCFFSFKKRAKVFNFFFIPVLYIIIQWFYFIVLMYFNSLAKSNVVDGSSAYHAIVNQSESVFGYTTITIFAVALTFEIALFMTNSSKKNKEKTI